MQREKDRHLDISLAQETKSVFRTTRVQWITPHEIAKMSVRSAKAPTELLMLRIIICLIALLMYPATAASADSRYCGHASELATARLRWEAARRSPTDPALREKNCRAYGIQFYEAVTARQATSACRDGIDRRRDLELFDAEIDAFNNFIAAQCGG
jgi:hypothetical protein